MILFLTIENAILIRCFFRKFPYAFAILQDFFSRIFRAWMNKEVEREVESKGRRDQKGPTRLFLIEKWFARAP
jgi:hypothetical protein